MKITPADKSKKIVVFDEIDIFFKESVGILLTRSKAIKIVKNGVKFFISKFKVNPDSS